MKASERQCQCPINVNAKDGDDYDDNDGDDDGADSKTKAGFERRAARAQFVFKNVTKKTVYYQFLRSFFLWPASDGTGHCKS